MHILVLGSTGMLGHMVLKVLQQHPGWEVLGTQFEYPTGAGYFRVEEGRVGLVWLGTFDYAINCIGITAKNIVPNDNASVERATLVNSTFPHQLAEYGQSMGMNIIHMSTDGVFSGSTGPYTEDSPTDCTDVYGISKKNGEVRASNVINIRTSIIGPSPLKKEGLWEWFLGLPTGSAVNGFTNHIWNGVTTLQFAQLCLTIIQSDAFNQLRAESSLFHFAPNEPVTKCQLLEMFKTTFKKNILVNPIEDPRGAVRRVLMTRYKGLQLLVPHGKSMADAIAQLSPQS